jgi:RNA polymerase subunit RPABC4/transcription elongation factor Spt4
MSQTGETAESVPEENPSAIQCHNCNTILPTNAMFCGVCGERLQTSNTRKQLSWPWLLIIVLSALSAVLATMVIPDTPVGLIIVMWFLFVCPGMMLVRFLRLNEPVAEWVLALALSFAIDAIVAGILIYMGTWSPTGILAILIGFSVGGEMVQLISTRLAALPVSRWFTRRLSQKPVVLLPLLFTMLFIASLAAASTWSPVYTVLSKTTGSPSQVRRSAVSFASTRPTKKVYATSAPTDTVQNEPCFLYCGHDTGTGQALLRKVERGAGQKSSAARTVSPGPQVHRGIGEAKDAPASVRQTERGQAARRPKEREKRRGFEPQDVE